MRTFGIEAMLALAGAVALTWLCVSLGEAARASDPESTALQAAGEAARLLTFTLGIPAAVLALFNHRRSIETHARADLWKRQEYVARYVMDFEARPENRFVMALLDYNRRALQPPGGGPPQVFTDLDVMTALAPRNARGVYTPADTMIRDAFDCFLGGLDRLGVMCDVGLVDYEDVGPYIQYWLELLEAGPRKDEPFGALVRRYLDTFHFTGARGLLRKAGVKGDYTSRDKTLVTAFVASLTKRGRPAVAAKAAVATPVGGRRRKRKSIGEEENPEPAEDAASTPDRRRRRKRVREEEVEELEEED